VRLRGSNYTQNNFSGDKRIFTLKCLKNQDGLYFDLTCEDSITRDTYAGLYPSMLVNWCSNHDEIPGDLIKNLHNPNITNRTDKAIDDGNTRQCQYHDINFTDGLGRKNNIKRAVTFMLINDCRLCL